MKTPITATQTQPTKQTYWQGAALRVWQIVSLGLKTEERLGAENHGNVYSKIASSLIRVTARLGLMVRLSTIFFRRLNNDSTKVSDRSFDNTLSLNLFLYFF